MREGIVLGAICGLSFAADEFATVFAAVAGPVSGWAAVYTDLPARRALAPIGVIAVVVVTRGFRDRMGESIAPVSPAILDRPLASLGLRRTPSDQAGRSKRPCSSGQRRRTLCRSTSS